jgi:hypothetical protein
MIALLIAAGVVATPPAVIGHPNPAQRCDLWSAKPTRDLLPPGMARAPHSLGQEPAADMHLLVLRRDAQGCSVPVIVRYKVEGDGTFAKDARP